MGKGIKVGEGEKKRLEEGKNNYKGIVFFFFFFLDEKEEPGPNPSRGVEFWVIIFIVFLVRETGVGMRLRVEYAGINFHVSQ